MHQDDLPEETKEPHFEFTEEMKIAAHRAHLARQAEYPDCSWCKLKDAPSHRGSFACQSGSIASGGGTAHCSCDTCW